MRKLTAVGALLLAMSAAATGQLSLQTTFTSNNGFAGNMFDVVGLNSIVITGFDVNLAVGTHVIEVWTITAGTTYAGNNQSAANWTQVATVPNVVSTAQDAPTAVPFVFNIPVNSGQQLGIYITTQGTTMRYTNGTVMGAIYAQNADLQILEGHGGGYPFALTNVPRVWNGRLYYSYAANDLTATTTGGGTGDLTIALTAIAAGSTEGYVLVTSVANNPLGTGPVFGIYPDSLTWGGLQAPLTLGNPLHFAVGFTGFFPDTPFIVPPGALSFLAGQTWDAVAVLLGPALDYKGRSAVRRLVW
jgi:hypothetical protein